MPRALLVLAKNGFQDHELQGVREALFEAGFHVILAAKEKGSCVGKYGSVEEAVIALRDIDAENYDRIALIGGPGAHELIQDSEAHALCHRAFESKKPFGALCIAPTILAASGVLRGKKATVWDDGEGTQIRLLEEAGATYTGDTVTVDGNIVTGNGPDAAEEFGAVFASM